MIYREFKILLITEKLWHADFADFFHIIFEIFNIPACTDVPAWAERLRQAGAWTNLLYNKSRMKTQNNSCLLFLDGYFIRI